MTTPPTDHEPQLPIAGIPDDEGDSARAYPVESWHPTRCGHSHMRIDVDGRWFHEGTEILRPKMVSLFARLLRREPDGRHVLVTPVEMLDIEVEDAPLIATELATEGSGNARSLRFRIGATGQWVSADAAHRIIVEGNDDQPRPYLRLDAGLRARIARSVYYLLADLAIEEGHQPAGLWSGGHFQSLESAA